MSGSHERHETTSMKLLSQFASLGSTFSSKVSPQPLTSPKLIHLNKDVSELTQSSHLAPSDFTKLCNGEWIPEGSQPVAMVYAGHQFGSWVPQLGDGRAILLGEAEGTDGCLYDLQLKGSGLTPYSRDGDGRAVLRSTIREYVCSEAMHALGIPTTRSLCMIDSCTPVYREKTETGAAMIRISESFIRFGTFEYFSYSKQYEALQTLGDYVIERHFPEWSGMDDRINRLFSEAVKRTAELIAHWQAVGWCHGVMNTDNMSILGLTIDYGPFGFLDGFDAGHICNHSDWQGRYAFQRQPHVGHWNCAALAQALLPVMKGGKEAAEKILSTYPKYFASKYLTLMRLKLGLQQQAENDSQLINDLLQLMQAENTDYALFFRKLSRGNARDMFIDRENFDAWHKKYQTRQSQEENSTQAIQERMLTANPEYLLRNHLLQIAIDKAEEGDYSEVEKLMNVMRHPFEKHRGYEHFADFPPEWAQHLEISCSS